MVREVFMSVRALFPYLRAKDANAAAAFYVAAFGARELFRLVEPTGRIGHLELELAEGVVVMVSDEFPEIGIRAVAPGDNTGVTLHLHVDNADATIARAVEHGARLLQVATDAFHGERSGVVRDPFGYVWLIGHTIEEISPEEMQRRYTALMTEEVG